MVRPIRGALTKTPVLIYQNTPVICDSGGLYVVSCSSSCVLVQVGLLQAFEGYNEHSDVSVRHTSMLTVDPCGHCVEAGEFFTENAFEGIATHLYYIQPPTLHEATNVVLCEAFRYPRRRLYYLLLHLHYINQNPTTSLHLLVTLPCPALPFPAMVAPRVAQAALPSYWDSCWRSMGSDRSPGMTSRTSPSMSCLPMTMPGR